MVVAAEQGLIHDMDSDGAMADLVRRGTCILCVCVFFVGDSDYEVVWTGFAGRSIAVGNQVILSRSHPWRDAYRHPCVVLQKERSKLVMQLTQGGGPRTLARASGMHLKRSTP